MYDPSLHRADPARARASAASDVLGVYDSIDEAEWAAGVLTSHGIGVDGISLVEPTTAAPRSRTSAAAAARRETLAVLADLVRGTGQLYGWDSRRPPQTGRRPPRHRQRVMAILHGTTDDTDLAQRILADHAARAGRV